MSWMWDPCFIVRLRQWLPCIRIQSWCLFSDWCLPICHRQKLALQHYRKACTEFYYWYTGSCWGPAAADPGGWPLCGWKEEVCQVLKSAFLICSFFGHETWSCCYNINQYFCGHLSKCFVYSGCNSSYGGCKPRLGMPWNSLLCYGEQCRLDRTCNVQENEGPITQAVWSRDEQVSLFYVWNGQPWHSRRQPGQDAV